MTSFRKLSALATRVAGVKEKQPKVESHAGQAQEPVKQASVEKSAASKELAVKFLQCIPANLKLIHVATKSYAKHMALDDAFEALNDALDEFYECVQGHYVLKTGSRIKLSNEAFTFETPSDDAVLDAVKKMEKAFRSAAAEVTDGDAALESVRDNVTNSFQQLAYRLTLK